MGRGKRNPGCNCCGAGNCVAFEDDFTSSTAESLQAGWSVTGSVDMESNAARLRANGDRAIWDTDTSSDQYLSIQLMDENLGHPGGDETSVVEVYFGWLDSSNHYRLDIALGTDRCTYELYEVISGTPTSIDGPWYSFSVSNVYDGTTISGGEQIEIELIQGEAIKIVHSTPIVVGGKTSRYITSFTDTTGEKFGFGASAVSSGPIAINRVTFGNGDDCLSIPCHYWSIAGIFDIHTSPFDTTAMVDWALSAPMTFRGKTGTPNPLYDWRISATTAETWELGGEEVYRNNWGQVEYNAFAFSAVGSPSKHVTWRGLWNYSDINNYHYIEVDQYHTAPVGVTPEINDYAITLGKRTGGSDSTLASAIFAATNYRGKLIPRVQYDSTGNITARLYDATSSTYHPHPGITASTTWHSNAYEFAVENVLAGDEWVFNQANAHLHPSDPSQNGCPDWMP